MTLQSTALPSGGQPEGDPERRGRRGARALIASTNATTVLLMGVLVLTWYVPALHEMDNLDSFREHLAWTALSAALPGSIQFLWANVTPWLKESWLKTVAAAYQYAQKAAEKKNSPGSAGTKSDDEDDKDDAGTRP